MDPLDDPSMTSPHALAPAPNGLRNLLLWTTIPALLAGILLVLHFVRPFGRPVQVVQKALEALSAGDAERLRSEERLGFQRRAEREIKRRGEAEYTRVLAIFEKEAQFGDREYRRIRKKLAELGDREFRKLSRDDQRTLREFSHRQFVADKGWAQLSDDERKQVGSAEVLGDRAKLRARAIAVGLPTLTEDQQNAADGEDLTSAESAKDKKLGKIANLAEKAGLTELQPALQSAESAAAVELARLSRRERERVEYGSYNRWVFEAGFKATDDKMRAKASLVQMIDDDAPEAWALRRTFGNKDLDPESRKQLEGLDYDKFIAARRVYIDLQGMRLWGEQLRETFNPGCCKTGTVRYLGDSGRSLLRNDNATVALDFGPIPPKPPKKDKDNKKVEDDDIETVHPARKYLGQTTMLEYRWGTWTLVGFEAGSEDDPAPKHHEDALKSAMGALSSLGGGMSGGLIFFGLALVLLLLVLLKRKAGAGLTSSELVAAGAALGLAALQIAAQGQATLDDLWFTPLYLAIPIWVGTRRGAESGFVAGFLVGVSLVVVSTVAGVPSWASVAGNHLQFGEHLLAALLLAGTGALAGRAKWPAELPVALPLLWLLFFAAIDRSQLASLTSYAHVLLAMAITGLGLLLHRLGLLRVFSRMSTAEDA